MAGGIYDHLLSRGVTRRDFLKFCSATAATLGLSSSMVPQIANALEKKERPSVVWLHFSECTGDSESVVRASKPSIGKIVLDVISLDYHETLMAPSGHYAEKSLHDTITKNKGKYIAVYEGAIPRKDGGIYCCVAGKSALETAKEVAAGAAANIAVGNCACFGGVAAAKPNPTDCCGIQDVIGGTVVNIAGCPMNCENFTAVIVHLLTFGSLPALDKHGRPLFAYGKLIHNNCERRPHFDQGQFVRQWGDAGHRQGWCLYEMGCKGPMAYQNCPTIRWNEGTSWPVMAGHPCIACASPNNWDDAYPFYQRMKGLPGVGWQADADKIG
ncbi:MAG TPA: hydrogenase small subunit, partial [Dissulfurispiraceae bacterium]|nr:hydrogenase small subunit [Dissulfurispiraceae bacterium]